MQHIVFKRQIFFLLTLIVAQVQGTAKIERLKTALRWAPHITLAGVALGFNFATAYEYATFQVIPSVLLNHNGQPVEAAVEIRKLRDQCIFSLLGATAVMSFGTAQMLAHHESKILKYARKTPGMICSWGCAGALLCHWKECYQKYKFRYNNNQTPFIFEDIVAPPLGTLLIGGMAALFAYGTYLA